MTQTHCLTLGRTKQLAVFQNTRDHFSKAIQSQETEQPKQATQVGKCLPGVEMGWDVSQTHSSF